MNHEILKDLGKGIKAGIINITPEQAKKMLEKNDVNRKINYGYVSRYKLDLIEGMWNLNGAPIIFSDNGRLLDGQHRLTAIIEAGISTEMIVITGIRENVFTTIDTGKTRSSGDTLNIVFKEEGNYRDANKIASFIQSVYLYDRGLKSAYILSAPRPKAHNSKLKNRLSLTNQLVIDFYKNNRIEIDHCYDFIFKVSKGKTKLLKATMMMLFYWILQKINREEAMLFFTKLTDGSNLRKDSSIYALREKIISINSDKNSKLQPTQLANLFFKSWNYYRRGKPITRLNLSNDLNIEKPI